MPSKQEKTSQFTRFYYDSTDPACVEARKKLGETIDGVFGFEEIDVTKDPALKRLVDEGYLQIPATEFPDGKGKIHTIINVGVINVGAPEPESVKR